MFNMTIRSVCQECIKHSGGCCTAVKLSIHSSELNVFLEYIMKNSLPEGHILDVIDEEKDVYQYSSGEDRCVFLDKNNQCQIYSNRPFICRMYPIMWKAKENLFLDMTCPLLYVIPIRDIVDWVNEPRNQEQLKIIDDLNFLTQSNKYLSFTSLKNDYPVLEITKKEETRE